MTTAFVRSDIDAIRRAYKAHTPCSRRVDTPDGYERLEVAVVNHTPHTDKLEHYWDSGTEVIIQYWYKRRNIERFKNYTSLSEWMTDVKNM